MGRKQQFLFVILLFFLKSSYAVVYTVPFQNLFLQPGQTIKANYFFNLANVMFCFATNTQIGGIIKWPYNGTLKSGLLPIFLKVNPMFQGYYIDARGTLTISNNTGELLQIGCLWAY